MLIHAYIYIYIFFAVLGLCFYAQAFSSCSEQGIHFRCSAQASHCGGFSCCSFGVGGFFNAEPLAKLQI